MRPPARRSPRCASFARRLGRSLRPALAAIVWPMVAAAQGGEPARRKSSDDSLSRAVLAELVGINTAPSGGEMTRANRAMARRLLAAGYPASDVQLVGPDARHLNLVARLKGRDPAAKPVVLMAHVDVVEALRSDWSMDPFTLHEKDGYFYGRGISDDKGGAATLVANMVRFRKEKFVPARDLYLVLTVDEETSAEKGIIWLLKNKPELTKADYALNIDAGGILENPGATTGFFVQSSEKMYQDYTLEVLNRGGHSSLPRDDNAIYSLAAGLARLERYRFPVMLNDVVQTYFARSAALMTGDMAEAMRAVGRGDTSATVLEVIQRDPQLRANLRTACVATMLSGGHAPNALPQRAAANVNCRIFPGVSAEEVRKALESVVADTSIHVKLEGAAATPSGASPLRPDVFGTIESITASIWPGSATIPMMENGATDGLHLRNLGIPVYGVAGPLYDGADDRAHGRDERVSVRHYYQLNELWYRMVKELLGGRPVS